MNKKMGSIMIILLLITALLSSSGCKSEESGDYFPIGEGSYWEYNVYSLFDNGLSKISKDITMVTGKELVDDIECYRVDYYIFDPGTPSVGHYREFFAKTEEGVSVNKRSFPLLRSVNIDWELRNNPGEYRYKEGLKPGDTWQWEGFVTLEVTGGADSEERTEAITPKIERIKGAIDYEYKGKETINVLNKSMECMKFFIHAQSEDKQEYERFVWYAPEIGRVREETTYYKGSDVVKNLHEITGYNITNREIFKK